jgi:flagellar motility protein MotE (MotC chaperone)
MTRINLNPKGCSIKSFLGALVMLVALLSPFASCLSLAQEAEPDAAKADSPATEEAVAEAEEVEEPAKLPERPPSVSPETFRMIETIEQKNRELKRREEEIRLKEKHLKALANAIREDLAKIEGALQRSREQIGIKDELIQENINALVKAYSTMKADKAATLIEALNEDLALQIISGMKAKVAGKVLSRLNVKVAKNISEKLAGQRKKKANKK